MFSRSWPSTGNHHNKKWEITNEKWEVGIRNKAEEKNGQVFLNLVYREPPQFDPIHL